MLTGNALVILFGCEGLNLPLHRCLELMPTGIDAEQKPLSLLKVFQGILFIVKEFVDFCSAPR